MSRKRPLTLLASAESDLAEALEHLHRERESSAKKFDRRIHSLFERIESMPFMFGKVGRRVRAVQVKGFRYVVYYVVYLNLIEVIAIIHGSRSPSVWKSRL